MPVHIRNILKMKGLSSLPIFSNSDDDFPDGTIVITNACNIVRNQVSFDFNKVIPMPGELDLPSGSMVEESIVYYLTNRCRTKTKNLKKPARDLINKLIVKEYGKERLDYMFKYIPDKLKKFNENRAEFYKKGAQYVENFKEYGEVNFENWCRNNWGTSWNVLDTGIIDDDTIAFDSAWNNPEPIIKRLSQMYPDVQIEHWWSSSGWIEEGYRKMLNGKEVESCIYEHECEEQAAIYRKCWGEDQNE